MRKGWVKGLLLCVLTVLLSACASGCLFKPAENLFALPVLPEEYSDLQATIQMTIDELGAEYATISSGDHTSTVQLLDLDGDGEQETAAVFLRVTDAVEKPVRVCLYRRNSEGDYKAVHMLEGDGVSINSIAYEDLTGDGVKELIVSWQMSSRVYILSTYQLTSEGVEVLLSTTYNEGYLVANMDGSGGKELLVFQQNSTGDSGNWAEYYRYQDGAMTMASSTRLSNSALDVRAAQLSRLSDGSRGVYVTSATENGMLTDILVLSADGLRNVTRDPESGNSLSTSRTYTDVGAKDINGDGVLEIPLPVQAAGLEEGTQSPYYIIYWRQFDQSGNPAVSCASYHSTSDGWYLMIPNGWLGSITVSRNDALSTRGERSVIFYYTDTEEGQRPAPFLTIYRLTGSNRSSRAKLPGRFILRSDATTIYAAALHETNWNIDIAKEELVQRFYLITAEWSAQ